MISGKLPGGDAIRLVKQGLEGGAPLTVVHGPEGAFSLVALDMLAADRLLSELLMSEVRAIPSIAGHLADAGGKRLRPALSALGAHALGLSRNEAFHRLMCVGEMIHLGSLLHDDVVDQGDMRRNRPAAHCVYGNAVSVLTGDFCLARAVSVSAECGGHDAVRALGRAVTAMAEGEVLQLQRAGDLGCTREDYLEVIERKSAALIAWSCAAAAYVLNDHAAAEALETFGYGVGVAFQITDDVLDYSAGTGKNPGVDLRERKVTLPLLIAMERLPWLKPELERGAPSDERIASLMNEIRECGALSSALAEAHVCVDRGVTALAHLDLNAGREGLVSLGRHLVDRAL